MSKFDGVSRDEKFLCKSPQEQLPDGGIACTFAIECSRTSHNLVIPKVLQQAIPGSQNQQPMETYIGPQYREQVFKDRHSKWRLQSQ